MAWVILVIAGFLEIGWAVGLKFTKRIHSPVANGRYQLSRWSPAWCFSVWPCERCRWERRTRCVDRNRHSRHRDSRHGPAW